MDDKVYDSYGASLRSGIREMYGVDGSGFSTVVFNDGGSLTSMIVSPLRDREWAIKERAEFAERMKKGIENKVGSKENL